MDNDKWQSWGAVGKGGGYKQCFHLVVAVGITGSRILGYGCTSSPPKLIQMKKSGKQSWPAQDNIL